MFLWAIFVKTLCDVDVEVEKRNTRQSYQLIPPASLFIVAITEMIDREHKLY